MDAEVGFAGLEAFVDDFNGAGAVFDFLKAGVGVLLRFVDREEVLDLGKDVFGQVGDVFALVHLRFFEGNGSEISSQMFMVLSILFSFSLRCV